MTRPRGVPDHGSLSEAFYDVSRPETDVLSLFSRVTRWMLINKKAHAHSLLATGRVCHVGWDLTRDDEFSKYSFHFYTSQASSGGQSKPQSAWMLFIQERREQVKRDNPDIAVTQQQKV